MHYQLNEVTTSYHSDNAELVTRIRNGDKKAHADFYNRFYQQLYLHIFNMVRNKDVADDLISITFIKAFAKLDTYVENISLFMWLKTIATNTTIDFIRSNKSTNTNWYIDDEDYHLQLETVDDNGPLAKVELEELQAQIKSAMKKLKAKHQEILELKLEGLSYKQIADKLKITESMVKSQLNKARTKLKTLLTINNKNLCY